MNKLFILFLSLILLTRISFAANVSVFLEQPSTNIAGSKIYYGISSGVYTSVLDVNLLNNTIITNLTPNKTYYFAATVYDSDGLESLYSDEATYTTPPFVDTNKYVYIGIQLSYGTNLTSLSYKRVQVRIFTNAPPGQFYRSSLILTNRPFEGIITTNDTNRYHFLGSKLQYGTGLLSLFTEIYPIYIVTNPPPNQFYGGRLIITNKAFDTFTGNARNILILNNSFESPNAVGYIGDGYSNYLYHVVIDGWNTVGILATTNSAWPVTSVPDGNQLDIVQGAQTLSQSINSLSTANYTLTFYAAYRNAQNGGQDISVQIDGIEVMHVAAVELRPNDLNAYSKNFQITKGNHILSFVFTNNGGDCSDYIDKITLTYP